MRRMVALHDAEVESMIITLLFKQSAMGDTNAVVRTRYLPFQFSPMGPSVKGAWLEADIKRAIHLFQEVQNRGPRDSVIMLGSQRANYLVECKVADLFNCKPFERASGKPSVPFYLCYRGFDRQVPSCFGGLSGPPGLTGTAKRGTYYIDENNRWISLEWKQAVQDAGIVIVIREPERVELVVIGFSGRATCALGKELVENPEKFWPEEFRLRGADNGGERPEPDEGRGGSRKRGEKTGTTIEVDGKEIGIYACRATFCNGSIDENRLIQDEFEVDRVDVIPLGEKVLRRFLDKRRAAKR